MLDKQLSIDFKNVLFCSARMFDGWYSLGSRRLVYNYSNLFRVISVFKIGDCSPWGSYKESMGKNKGNISNKICES